MITKKELEEIARLKGMNLGNAEKDYLLDIALLSISRNTKNELVFKGGTCLYKFYNLSRFSEDLDFSAVKEIDVDKLIQKVILDFEKFGIKANMHKKKEPYNSILITLRIEGPLFNGKSMSYANIGIDINKKSEVMMVPDINTYTPIYQEVPQINVLCMALEEIFSEKIRALMSRERARDLFDLHFLLQKGISADELLISKKMLYYNEKFYVKKLCSKISMFSSNWNKELVGLTKVLPNFEKVKEETIKKLNEIYKN